MTLAAVLHQGGPLMWPLAVCSLAVCTVCVERGLFWLGMLRGRDTVLREALLAPGQTEDVDELLERAVASPDPVARMLAAGLRHRGGSLEAAMEEEARKTLADMGRFLDVLDTMITVAPLLGILGTVLGIISSFHMLGQAGISDPRLVTAGIAQALLTTAAGLGIAIAALIPYNIFRRAMARAARDMESHATALELAMDMGDDCDQGGVDSGQQEGFSGPCRPSIEHPQKPYHRKPARATTRPVHNKLPAHGTDGRLEGQRHAPR